MQILALSTFVLPGALVTTEGEVYDLPDRYAIEAISLGTAAAWIAPQESPKTKSKKGTADV
jgi:hypothetical protein